MADRGRHFDQRFAAPLVECERPADDDQRQDEDTTEEAAGAHGPQRLGEGRLPGKTAIFTKCSASDHASHQICR
jgi:hypothetical protein